MLPGLVAQNGAPCGISRAAHEHRQRRGRQKGVSLRGLTATGSVRHNIPRLAGALRGPPTAVEDRLFDQRMKARRRARVGTADGLGRQSQGAETARLQRPSRRPQPRSPKRLFLRLCPRPRRKMARRANCCRRWSAINSIHLAWVHPHQPPHLHCILHPTRVLACWYRPTARNKAGNA